MRPNVLKSSMEAASAANKLLGEVTDVYGDENMDFQPETWEIIAQMAKRIADMGEEICRLAENQIYPPAPQFNVQRIVDGLSDLPIAGN